MTTIFFASGKFKKPQKYLSKKYYFSYLLYTLYEVIEKKLKDK